MPRSRDTWEMARAFLILFAGVEAVLLVIAVVLGAKLENLRTDLILFVAASGVAALGLFMTSGDSGGRITNAAKTLFVLFVLVGGVVVLLLWAATTASNGS